MTRLKSIIFHAIHLFIFAAAIHINSGAYLTGSNTPDDNHKIQSQPDSDPDKYRLRMQERGLGKDGIPACTLVYGAPDGTQISTWTYNFRSEASMKSEYRTSLKKFAETIESGDVKYVGSDTVGKRIVGKIQYDKNGKEQYHIITVWSSRREISYIQSSSLDHALDFENKRYKPKSSLKPR